MATLGTVHIDMTAGIEAFRKFREAIVNLDRIIKEQLPQLIREAEDLYRQQWWDRGEDPPEFIADANKPEWWQEGHGPPGFCAA